MGLPSSMDARRFYRCAKQRFEEAEILMRAGKTTGAVYLAGYGVECILKTLTIMAVPQKNRSDIMLSFRGSRAHDYEWLRDLYLNNGGARFPSPITQHFTFVNSWSTDLRYQPRSVPDADAEAFVTAAEAIIIWADGRL